MLMPFQGQFASKAFDGDPYIEIMRVLPDKELCWWIQKVIWVSSQHMKSPLPVMQKFHSRGAL